MITSRYLIAVCFLLLILSSCGSAKKTSRQATVVIIDDGISEAQNTNPPSTTVDKAPLASKSYSALQKKYATFLKATPDEITNLRLFGFIDNWLGTPYLWGGTTRRGIDCSAFVQQLIDYVYDVNLPRTSIEQFYTDWIELFGSREYLSEGDLVFFRTIPGTLVSHIGFYLKNNMFVNSSSSKGVSIASLEDPYWKKKFVAAGRIKSSVLVNYRKSH